MNKKEIANLNILIDLKVMHGLGLSINEYSIAYFIHQAMTNPESGMDGWSSYSLPVIANNLKISRDTVIRTLKKLHKKGLVERAGKTQYLRTTVKWYRETVNIQNATTSSKMLLPVAKSTKEKESNKEREYINIPVSTKQDDVPSKGRSSCPLLHSPLKDSWPRGHIECVEYVTSYKFVNKSKQFKFLHAMLRSGLDFGDIDRILVRVEKSPFYVENGWDFATLASEADRRHNARN